MDSCWHNKPTIFTAVVRNVVCLVSSSLCCWRACAESDNCSQSETGPTDRLPNMPNVAPGKKGSCVDFCSCAQDCSTHKTMRTTTENASQMRVVARDEADVQ